MLGTIIARHIRSALDGIVLLLCTHKSWKTKPISLNNGSAEASQASACARQVVWVFLVCADDIPELVGRT